MLNKNHPLKQWKNPWADIKNQEPLSVMLGMFLVSASPMIAECCAMTDLDWIAIDMEASAATRKDLLHMTQAFNGSSMALLVRVAENNQQYIEGALDIGVHGIIVPKVSCREEALAAVDACYYAPRGKRGLNPIRCSAYFDCVTEYIKQANQISCLVQIETKNAVKHVDEIASVSGIKGLFIGCGDLAMDYGVPGNFEDPQMNEAIEAVLAACKKHHLIAGIFAYSQALAKKYKEMGFSMIGLGNEIKFLRSEIQEMVGSLK